MKILENTVDGLTELRHVKATAVQLQVTTSTVISYDIYVSLLYSAAQSYDTQFSTRINSKGKNARYINMKQFQKKMMKNMNTVLTQTKKILS